MKKHQTIAIVAIIILAIAVGVVITLSKKTVEAPVTTSAPITETPAPTTSTPHETINPEAKVFTLAEVAPHNSRASCYAAISGSVYDLTLWISQNPGGQFPILALCGKEGRVPSETEITSFKIGTLVQ